MKNEKKDLELLVLNNPSRKDDPERYDEILDEILEKIGKEPKFRELVEKLAKS